MFFSGASFTIRHWCHRYPVGPFVFLHWKILNKQCFLIFFFVVSSTTFPLLIRINSTFIWYSDFVRWILFCDSAVRACVRACVRAFVCVKRPFFLVSSILFSFLLCTTHFHAGLSVPPNFQWKPNKLIMINLLHYFFLQTDDSILQFSLFFDFSFDVNLKASHSNVKKVTATC